MVYVAHEIAGDRDFIGVVPTGTMPGMTYAPSQECTSETTQLHTVDSRVGPLSDSIVVFERRDGRGDQLRSGIVLILWLKTFVRVLLHEEKDVVVQTIDETKIRLRVPPFSTDEEGETFAAVGDYVAADVAHCRILDKSTADSPVGGGRSPCSPPPASLRSLHLPRERVSRKR